jgi:hypothetical protein
LARLLSGGQRQAGSFAALTKAHVIIQSSNVLPIVVLMRQSMGLARAVMGSLRNKRWRGGARRTAGPSVGLRDGLSISIRIRLSSRACEGAWAGPDAMGVGVAFAPRALPALKAQ